MAGQLERVGVILEYLLHYLQRIEEHDRLSGLKEIPPILLQDLVKEPEKKEEKKETVEDTYSFLSSARSRFDDSDDDEKPRESTSEKSENLRFTGAQGRQLSELVSSVSLPRILPPVQMLLMGLIDTFCQVNDIKAGLDDCAVKFLVSFKVFSFLKKTGGNRNLSSVDFCWAFFTQTQEPLLTFVFPEGSNWSFARSIGMGYWIQSSETLKSLLDKMSKTQFGEKKDPYDCALFYVLLNKKGALAQLFQATGNKKVSDFLKFDFSEPKYKKAAHENAFRLMGLGQFQMAATMFLLGGSLKDATNVIIQKLKDYQLALVAARLVEGEGGAIYNGILKNHLLPFGKESGDAALISLSNWMLRNYSDSAQALVSVKPKAASTTSETSSSFGKYCRWNCRWISHKFMRTTQYDI